MKFTDAQKVLAQGRARRAMEALNEVRARAEKELEDSPTDPVWGTVLDIIDSHFRKAGRSE